MTERREYLANLIINGARYRRIVIDPHYEQRHRHSMSDPLILGLVGQLSGRSFLPEVTLDSGFKIYVNDPWFYEGKAYRLIWTIHPDKDYVGIINAFRSAHGKKN